MNIEIITKTENKLLERKEIEADVSFTGPTPKKADIKQKLGAKLAASADLMVIRRITSRFGRNSVRVVAHIYADEESLAKTEPDYIKKREGIQTEGERKEAAKKAAEEKKAKEAGKEEEK